MNTAVPVIDALALIAFGAALVMILSVRITPDGPLSVVSKTCAALGLAVYAFAAFSNVLEHSGVTAALDPIEDYLEILFPILVLYGVYAVHVRGRERELMSAQRAALRSQDMLLGIMDSTPAGILLLDSSGRVSFANEAAKRVLDIAEDAEGGFSDPGWTISVNGSPAGPTFAALLDTRVETEPVAARVEWPSGWRVDLDIRTETLADAAGHRGGLVATFLPPADMNIGVGRSA